MVRLSDLSNDENNRRLRDTIISGRDTIRVYEPSKKDIDVIIELQEKNVEEYRKKKDDGKEDDATKVTSSGTEVVRVLFPLLTDIKGIEDMTDEEVEFVVENPSLAFIQANHVIESIVTEVWKTIILSARNRVLDTDFRIESVKSINEMNEKTLGIVEREGKGRMDKFESASKLVEEAKKKKTLEDFEEIEQRVAEATAVKNTEEKPAQDISKEAISLEAYKKAFK